MVAVTVSGQRACLRDLTPQSPTPLAWIGPRHDDRQPERRKRTLEEKEERPWGKRGAPGGDAPWLPSRRASVYSALRDRVAASRPPCYLSGSPRSQPCLSHSRWTCGPACWPTATPG